MKLGSEFIKHDLAAEKQIKKALQIQRRTGDPLGEILLAMTNMRSQDYYKTLAEHFGLAFVDLMVKLPDISLLTDTDQALYLTQQTIPIRKDGDVYMVATSNPSLKTIDFIKSHWGNETKIVCTAKYDILSILQNRFGSDYLNSAINDLINANTSFSAKHTFSRWQLGFLLASLLLCIYLACFHRSWFFIFLNVYLTVSVSVMLLYKIVLSTIALFIKSAYVKINRLDLPKKNLPIYSILLPLYKEKEVTLRYLFHHLDKLHYPKHKLDVKILLEQDDTDTIAILKTLQLPSRYEFIYIPEGEPRTKAKACNYGLKFARGEYITLYDAEDQPDPYQLKKALYTFLNSGADNLACVQSRLNFYNSNENWLTRMFTIEYTYWFDLLLPALESLRTPIPLGGTSNHFKASILRDIDAWDPYNVAEDADLGIRLQRLGYITKIINSTTYEEANCQLINWIKQRTRWVKGYMQTYIVHMRNPFKLWRALGTRGFLGFHFFVGGSILSNLSYIMLWIIFIVYHSLTPAQDAYYFPQSFTDLALFNFVVGSGGIIFLNFLGIIRRKKYSLLLSSLTSPFYWLLISIASYRALYQLIFNPSYWDKTEHGLSVVLTQQGDLHD